MDRIGSNRSLCSRASLPSCHAVSAKTASVFFAVLATACFGLMITAGVGVIPFHQGLFMASGFGGAFISIIISAVLFILDKPAPRPGLPPSRATPPPHSASSSRQPRKKSDVIESVFNLMHPDDGDSTSSVSSVPYVDPSPNELTVEESIMLADTGPDVSSLPIRRLKALKEKTEELAAKGDVNPEVVKKFIQSAAPLLARGDEGEGDLEEMALTKAYAPEAGVKNPLQTPLHFTETPITTFKRIGDNLYFATEGSVWMKTDGDPLQVLDVVEPVSHFVVTEGSVFAASGNTLTSPKGVRREFEGEILHLAVAGDNLAVVYRGANKDRCVLVSQEDLADVLSVELPQSNHHEFAMIGEEPTLLSFVADIPAIQKTVIGNSELNRLIQFERPREVSGDFVPAISNFSLRGTQIIWNMFYESEERGNSQVLVLQGTTAVTNYGIEKTQMRRIFEDLPKHSKAMMLPSMHFVTASFPKEVRVWTSHVQAETYFKRKFNRDERLDGVELVGSRLVIQSSTDEYFDFKELDFSVAVPKPPKLGGIKHPQKKELHSTEAPISEVLRVRDQLYFATSEGISIKGEEEALLVHALENPSHFVVAPDGTIIAASANQLHIQGKDSLEFDGEILHLAHHGAHCVVVYRSGDQDKLALIGQVSLNAEKVVDLPTSAQHVFAVVEGKPTLFSAIDAEEGVFSIQKMEVDDPSKNYTFAFKGKATGLFNRDVSNFSIDGDRIVWNTFWEDKKIEQRVVLQNARACYPRVVMEKTAALKKLPKCSSVFVLPGERLVTVSDQLVLVFKKKKNGVSNRPLNRGKPTLGKPYGRGTALVLPLLEESKSTLLELDFATIDPAKAAPLEERIDAVGGDDGAAHDGPQSGGSGSSSPSKTPPSEKADN